MDFQRKYLFPVRQSNAFELLIDGEQYYKVMLNSIAAAEKYIFLEQYLVASCTIGKKFIQELAAAVHRGVKVYCLFDDYGSRELTQYSRQQLINAGIQLCFYNPVKLRHWQSVLFRDHRKLLLIDNRVGFVGGAGITDDFLSHGQHKAWHDIVLQIQGPVLNDWHQLFQETWQQITNTQTPAPVDLAPSPNLKLTGQVLINQPWHQEYQRMLLNKMRHAEHRIWITTPYFVPSWKLRRRLRRMASNGVDVRLLLPGDKSDHRWVTQAARRYYSRLLKRNIRIYEYLPSFTHAKIVLCDDWVSIGSSNLDRWNQRWNLDANQAIHDHQFAEKTKNIFLDDFKQSREITLEEWLQRPWWQRWHEGYAGSLVLLLEWLSRYLPKRRKN